MRTVLAVSAVLLSGCGLTAQVPGEVDVAGSALSSCEVALGSFEVALATPDGLAVGAADAMGRATVQRFTGSGCRLAQDGPLFAATRLLDADDRGGFYVFPALGDGARGLTTLVGDDRPGEGSVVRVDRSGALAAVARAGRGIWSFGVSPSGETLWMSSCGPTGIFSTQSMEKLPAPRMASPPSAAEGWVLTDDQTLWATVFGDPASAPALTRTTPSGMASLGSTLLDFGGASEPSKLARCGSALCGFTSRGVVLWSSEGQELGRLDGSALGLRDGESVAAVTGNALGLYVTATGERTRRLVFVPRGGHSR